MPRVSQRARMLRKLEQTMEFRLQYKAMRMYDSDEDSLEDLRDLAAATLLSEIRKRRYYSRPSKYRKSRAAERFAADLNEDLVSTSGSSSGAEMPWLTDDEFLQKYRVTRFGFKHILEKIESHPIFGDGERGRRMAPPQHQLMVFLKYVGTEGAGGSNANQRHTFGCGYGTSYSYRKRVTRALRDLSPEYISWPDREERKKIGRAFANKYDFPHCVGVADGTLFPLAFEPQTEDAPDYSGRKYGYSLSTMIICDHTRRIRHYLAGYPGSAHDNRIWKDTALAKRPQDHFDNMQYLLGDSAFENDTFMGSAFKKPRDQAIPKQHENFNEKLATVRIISEHCIGVLKGRFPWLRSIRLLITKDKKCCSDPLGCSLSE